VRLLPLSLLTLLLWWYCGCWQLSCYRCRFVPLLPSPFAALQLLTPVVVAPLLLLPCHFESPG
jgi:hypothetical protein